VLSVAFDPTGELLASGGQDGTIRFWDVAGHRQLGEPLVGHAGPVMSVAFDPTGSTLASAGQDGTVRLWDVAEHEELGEPLAGHDGIVWSVAFSPTGETLASAGQDGSIRLWDSILWSDDFTKWQERLCTLVARNLTRREWSSFRPGAPYERTCPQWPIERG
jgi:WD40 repeat protein